MELTGPGGLLTGLVQRVLQSALKNEMTGHLGYERHDPVGKGSRLLPEWFISENCPDRGRGNRFGDPAGPGSILSRRS